MQSVFFLLIVVIAAVIVPLVLQQKKKTNAAWFQAADQLGLTFHPGTLLQGRSISGVYKGLTVSIDTYTRRSGNNSTTYTRFRIIYPRPLGIGLKLTRDGFFSNVTKLFGAQDIEVGDARFDDAVLVKGGHPQAVRRFLNSARRLRIQHFLSTYPHATIGDEELTWSTRGVVRDAGRLAAHVRRMVRLAWHLTGDRRDDESLQRAMTAQDAGRPDEALWILEEDIIKPREAAHQSRHSRSSTAPPPLPQAGDRTSAAAATPELSEPPGREESDQSADDPAQTGRALSDAGRSVSSARPVDAEDEEAADIAPVEERLFEGELLYMSGRRSEANAVFRRAADEAPDDEELRGWVEATQAESKGDTQGADSSPNRTEAASSGPQSGVAEERVSGRTTAQPGPQTVCEALFGEQMSSLQTNRKFERDYENCRVEWSGVLKRVDSYSYDFVFGEGPGTKAVVEVAEIESAFYGSRTVSAIVQLSESAAQTLQSQVGNTVVFSGTLIRVDAFMRNVFVGDAVLADNAAGQSMNLLDPSGIPYSLFCKPEIPQTQPMSQPAPLVKADRIGRRLADGRWLLRDVCVEVRAGDRWGVTGPTGSGKSLLLRSLALLDPIDAGSVVWRGRAVRPEQTPEFRSDVIYLHQRPVLLEGDVESNLRRPFSFGLRSSSKSAAAFDRDTLLQWLSVMGRGRSFLQQDSGELSGGESQIVALLRAIQLHPSVLLLDEPTSALDAESVTAIEELVGRWLNQPHEERATVWVSHDPQQIGRVADRILRLRNGRSETGALKGNATEP